MRSETAVNNFPDLPDPPAGLTSELLEARRLYREAQQRLDCLIEFAPEAIVLLDVNTGRFVDVNPPAEEMFGLSRDSLRALGPFDLSPPRQPDGGTNERGREYIAEALAGGTPIFQWWHCNAVGETFPCEVRLVKIPWGDRDVVRGIIIDITDRKRLELCERGRSRLLEQLALGISFREALVQLAKITEDILPRVTCSILLLEENQLRLGAGPSLPDFYNRAVDGLEIGPHVGSCGAAAYSGDRVIVEDVFEHENWVLFHSIAREANIRACWSEPIKSIEGEVLGTFAMYSDQPCKPAMVELQVIEFAAQLAATVIEHDRSQRLLKRTNRKLQQRVDERTAELRQTNLELVEANDALRLASVSFESYDSIIITDPNGRILKVNDSFTRLTGYRADEVIGQNPRILKSGRHDEAFYRDMWNAIRDKGYWEGEIWNKRKSGEIFPQRLSIRAVRDASGEVTHFVGDGQDISAQKEAAAAASAISIARSIQRSLFPKVMPNTPGFDIAGAVDAAEQVSGDYFDFIELEESRIFLAVADVCGHGLGPALLTAELHAYLRALAQASDCPGTILTTANRLFHRENAHSFATAFLLKVDPNSRCVTYAGAGHRGYVVRTDRSVDYLESTGLPLGIIREAVIESSQPIPLTAGDVVVLATDGIEETRRSTGPMWGKEQMFEVIRSHRSDSAT